MWRLPKDDLVVTQPTCDPGTPEHELMQTICSIAAQAYEGKPMTAVTVDLADLETIVFATGVIKTIEGVLASRRNDPFVRPHLDYAAAHDRLATAMRNASRRDAGTLVGFDEPLTKTEVRALRDVLQVADSGKGGLGDLPWFVISGADKAAPGEAMVG